MKRYDQSLAKLQFIIGENCSFFWLVHSKAFIRLEVVPYDILIVGVNKLFTD